MKKWITLLLAMAMMLSLCSCVSQEDYDALQAQLEEISGNYAALQSEYEKLEPAANEPSEGEQLYKKYADVVDALEAEDYDLAAAAIDARRPIPEETTIEITADNWQDYFDVVDVMTIPKNEFGKLEGEVAHTELVLKDEYSNVMFFDLRFLVDYDVMYYDVAINTDTGECTLSEIGDLTNATAISEDAISGYTEQDFVVDVWSDRTILHTKYGVSYMTGPNSGCQGGNSYSDDMPTDGGLYVPMVRNFVVKDVSGSITVS